MHKVRLWIRLITLLLASALGLGLAELGLRLFPPADREASDTSVATPHHSPMWQPDFRDRGEPGPKPAGTFRVLAVGDSFTWGGGVHARDAWPDRLGDALTGRTQPVEVVNWSRPGWNTAEEWRATGGALDDLDPDLVLLGFCLNDPEGSGRERRAAHQAFDAAKPPLLLRPLITASRVAGLFWSRWGALRRTRAVHEYHRSLYEAGPHLDACTEALHRFKRWGHHRQVPTLLVVMPIFGADLGPGYPYTEIHRRIDELAAGTDLEVLDLLPVYRGLAGSRLAVDPPVDPHPNELAHRIAADSVLAFLDERGLVPATQPQSATPSDQEAGSDGSQHETTVP